MEAFSLKKFFGSFFQWLPWVKTLRYAIGIALILGVILFVYLKFKPQTQNTTFSGSVGKVNIIQNAKRFFIPFIEGGVEQRQGADALNTYIRGGIRVEF